MEGRREFIKKIAGLFSGATILAGMISPILKPLYGREREPLFSAGNMGNIKTLSGRKLQVTPLSSFGVMGQTGIQVDKNEWHLEIHSKRGNFISYSYEEILKLPSFEKEVLLDCPGFFQNNGLWRGFSLGSILNERGMAEGIEKVEISGLNGKKPRALEFSIEPILSDRVFLAYGVNRETLPARHGFPLRVVAKGYAGSRWVKYVNKITLI